MPRLHLAAKARHTGTLNVLPDRTAPPHALRTEPHRRMPCEPNRTAACPANRTAPPHALRTEPHRRMPCEPNRTAACPANRTAPPHALRTEPNGRMRCRTDRTGPAACPAGRTAPDRPRLTPSGVEWFITHMPTTSGRRKLSTATSAGRPCCGPRSAPSPTGDTSARRRPRSPRRRGSRRRMSTGSFPTRRPCSWRWSTTASPASGTASPTEPPPRRAVRRRRCWTRWAMRTRD